MHCLQHPAPFALLVCNAKLCASKLYVCDTPDSNKVLQCQLAVARSNAVYALGLCSA